VRGFNNAAARAQVLAEIARKLPTEQQAEVLTEALITARRIAMSRRTASMILGLFGRAII
jgi:hypothetical protein